MLDAFQDKTIGKQVAQHGFIHPATALWIDVAFAQMRKEQIPAILAQETAQTAVILPKLLDGEVVRAPDVEGEIIGAGQKVQLLDRGKMKVGPIGNACL